MDQYSSTLLDAVDAVVAAWAERAVLNLGQAWNGNVSDQLRRDAAAAGQQTREFVVAELRTLFETDIDRQRSNPLAVLRRAVRFPTEVLTAHGVPEVNRPAFEEQAFPDDSYGLVPATWSDIDPSLHEPGLIWGAWKAKQHLDRHRPR